MLQLYKQIHDPSNFIHPTAIIGEDVIIGKHNYIGPNCVIYNNVEIGDRNRFEGFASIGSLPEHKDHFIVGTSFGVTISNNNTIREFTTINSGCTQNTTIGNNNIMLRGSHFSHDSIMENNVTLSCNVLIGGYSYIMEGANMGLGSICHQNSVIGAYSMVGMGGIVTKKSIIFPGHIYVGNPAKYLKENTIGLERAGISGSMLFVYGERYSKLQPKI